MILGGAYTTMQAALNQRTRNGIWCAARRNVKRSNPWLAGAPPFRGYLPAFATSLTIDPAPRWPIQLRNTRGLHGALTSVLGEGHRPRWPMFSLRATDLSPSGWAVLWWTPAAERLASASVGCRLYDNKETVLTFGPIVRLKPPNIVKRGHRLLRIDTITPVCVHHSDGTAARRVSNPSMMGTLGGEFLDRLGVQYLRERDLLRVEIVSTQRDIGVTVPLGGKYGDVPGWAGSFIVDTNAVGEWLLRVAAMVGMGSRTAFGMGQIRVSNETES